jgi:tol-pal system protein YbgF
MGFSPALRTPAFLLFVFLCTALVGCGPGFPIQTAEQAAYFSNVETLMKENAELKKRVSTLEKGGTAGTAQVRGELEDVKASSADAAVGIQEIRQEFSFIRGSFEEAEFERAQIKEDIRFTGESVKELVSRLETIETSVQASDERVSALEASTGQRREDVAGLGTTLSSLEERVAELESRAAAPPPPPPPSPAAAPPVEKKPEDLYARGLKHTKEKEYRKAADTFVKFLADFPDHKLADHAQYWLGEISYAKGDWERAILEFNKVIKNYPDGDKVPAATLKQAFSFEKIGSTKEARVLLEQVVEKFPKSNEAGMAKKHLQGLKSD